MLGSCPWRTVCGHGRPHTSATDGTGACSPRATAQCRRTPNVPQTYLPTAVRHRTCPMYLSTATGNQRCHGHTQPPNPVQSQSATNQLPAGPLVEMELDRVAIDGVAIGLPGDCARRDGCSQVDSGLSAAQPNTRSPRLALGRVRWPNSQLPMAAATDSAIKPQLCSGAVIKPRR